MDLIKIAEEAFATGKQHPSFKAGDTITVAYRIVEGSKERVQLYRGVVIKISGHGEKKRFTVRKMSGTVGVERIFPLNLRLSTASLSTKWVKFAALNCITCVHLPVRKPEFRKSVQTRNFVYSLKTDKIKRRIDFSIRLFIKSHSVFPSASFSRRKSCS